MSEHVDKKEKIYIEKRPINVDMLMLRDLWSGRKEKRTGEGSVSEKKILP